MKYVAILLVLIVATGMSAQELTIFDLNDFVDPRALGASATSRGRFVCPCTDVFMVRGMTGWDANFMNVTLPTAIDAGFVHVAASYYSRALQLNAKFTGLRVVSRPADVEILQPRAEPRESLTLQAAYYTASGLDANAFVSRTQLTWRMTHYVDHVRREGTDIVHHEFGVEWDPAVRQWIGSLVFTMAAGKNPSSLLDGIDNNVSRLAYVQRTGDYTFGPFRAEAALATGVLGEGFDFDRLRRLTVQPSLRLAWTLRKSDVTLNVRYAPSYQRLPFRSTNVTPVSPPLGFPPGYRWERTDELAIFVDARLFQWTRFRQPKRAD